MNAPYGCQCLTLTRGSTSTLTLGKQAGNTHTLLCHANWKSEVLSQWCWIPTRHNYKRLSRLLAMHKCRSTCNLARWVDRPRMQQISVLEPSTVATMEPLLGQVHKRSSALFILTPTQPSIVFFTSLAWQPTQSCCTKTCVPNIWKHGASCAPRPAAHHVGQSLAPLKIPCHELMNPCGPSIL